MPVLTALIISISVLVAALGFFAFTLSSMRKMLEEKQQAEDSLVESERHLQAIIDGSGAVIYVVGTNGKLVLVNREFERVFGAGRFESIGKSPDELFSSSTAAALGLQHAAALRTPGPVEYDLEIRLPAETRAYIGTRFALPDSAGRAYGTCCILQDVTERKRWVEERMKIFDLSLDLMCVTSFDGYQVHSNPQFCRVLGYTEEEFHSRPFYTFVHPDDHAATTKAVARLQAGEDLVDFENRGICKDGRVQRVSWRVAADLEAGSMICVGRPIGEPVEDPTLKPVAVPRAGSSALQSDTADSVSTTIADNVASIVDLKKAKARRDRH